MRSPEALRHHIAHYKTVLGLQLITDY